MEFHALKDINLVIPDGQFIGLSVGEDIAFASHIDADRSVPELLRLERPDGQGADIVLREGFSRDTPPVVYPRIV